jgi:hypothetical protein
MRKATFNYALGGKASRITKHAAQLIEEGVTSVASDCDISSGDHISAKLDEPLMVQASINFFGFAKTATGRFASTADDSAKGNVFEEFVLPSMQENFSKVLKAQLKPGDLGDLQEYAVPQWSTYGVLALDCKQNVKGTIAWIESALVARFEGAVAPFCYPDTHFGPDVVFFMHTRDYKNNRFVASQIKLKFVLSQAEALQTVVPDMFYHYDRLDL